MNCANHIIDALAPHREKRAYYESHMDEVKQILEDGEKSAHSVAKQTMNEVHAAMGIG